MSRWRWMYVALPLLSLLSIAPFVHDRLRMHYDSPFAISTLGRLTTPEQGYRARRVPGSPTFELLTAFLYKPFQQRGVTPEQAQFGLQWFSWVFAMMFMAVLYRRLRDDLTPGVAGLAAATVLLHPLFLWHEWAYVEDMFAVSLAFLGWACVAYRKDFDWGAVLLSIAVAAKALALPYAIAALVYLGLTRSPKEAARFVLFFAVTAFFFYAPALAWYGMDLHRLGETMHYGTSPHDRPAIGWLLARDSLLFYVPVGLALAAGLARRFRQRVSWRALPWSDRWLLVFAPFWLMDYYKFGYRYLVLGAGAAWLWSLRTRLREHAVAEGIAYAIMTVGVFATAFEVPYSRSYFLFALAPIVLLLTKRFQGRWFWTGTLALSLAPMFFYFQFRGKPPFFTLYPRGFYSAHRLSPYDASHNNEYNDGGLGNLPPVLQIPRRRS